MTYRQRPLKVDAVQWRGDNWEEVVTIFEPVGTAIVHDVSSNCLLVQTPEGRARCYNGEWVVRNVQGIFYPYSDAEFNETFESL